MPVTSAMDASRKNSTEGNPQEYDRSPQRPLHGSKDGAQACNVQKLYKKQLPLRHYHVINAVVDTYCRCFSVIRCKSVVDDFAVNKITAD